MNTMELSAKLFLMHLCFIGFANAATPRPSYTEKYCTTQMSPQQVSNNAKSLAGVLAPVAKVVFGAQCGVDGVSRAMANGEGPKTLDFARNTGRYKELSPEMSLLHNLKDTPALNTVEGRIEASIGALKEYYYLPPDQWQYLDPDLPNVKLVERDGHREYVYNKKTGNLVDKGPNQGTANDATDQESLWHWLDVGVYEACGVPSERDKIVARFMSSIGKRLSDLFLSKTARESNELEQVAEQNKRRKENQRHDFTSDLHTLNLDDPNGDWCKCDSPGCKEGTVGLNRYVQCQCAKCGKINVEYARRALAMEKEDKAKGARIQWIGNRSDAVRAANTQK